MAIGERHLVVMRIPVVMTLMLALVGCGSGASELSRSGFIGVELDTPRPVPDLVLTDHRGEPFNLASETAGRVALIFFGYTNCPDICPVHLANLAAVLNKLPDSDRRAVQVIFVTTDPRRDTLPRLAEWVTQFDRQFIGLTGDSAVIVEAEHALGVLPAAIPRNANGSNDYTVGHASQVIAVTRDGMARVQYPFGTRQRDWAHDIPLLIAHGD